MRRREFIAGVASAAALPLAVRAQEASLPLVGFLNSTSPDGYAEFVVAFHKGLAETGFVERQNVLIEYRWANGRYEQLPSLAAELAKMRLAVLFANGPATFPAKQATSTIPIVFTAGFDPVKLGVVASLARPGDNITGVSIMNVELAPKRLEVLQELAPGMKAAGLLYNPNNPNTATLLPAAREAARALGLQLHIQAASTAEQVDAAFAEFSRLGTGGVVVGTDPYFTTLSRQLAALCKRHAMPTIYQYREFVSEGGLISYGGSLADVYRQAGNHTGRILKGEKAGDLPVPQITKVEMMVNLKSARAMGLKIPMTLLARADEVIE
jgi:putative tryptophan/tyrosine transport system substrate-binding protein